jgi:ABC-type multidrug transport system fused ATPase/permease subunit
MSTALPTATRKQTLARARALIVEHRRKFLIMLALHGLAAIAGLLAPRLIGVLVDTVRSNASLAQVDRLAFGLLLALGAQTIITRSARIASYTLGETVLADLREDFLEDALALPLGTVERAGTGDLLTRSTSDIDAIGFTVRLAVPDILVSLTTIFLTFTAMAWVDPRIALPAIATTAFATFGTRWYLHRAPDAYQAERERHSDMNGQLAETTDGAFTVEALSLQKERVAVGDASVGAAYLTERRTLFIRTVYIPSVEMMYVFPTLVTLLFGGWMYFEGRASLGEITTIALYSIALRDPFDRLLMWLDELQVGATSLARIVGVGTVDSDRVATGREPTDDQIIASGVRYAYREDHDVLFGIDLELVPGERLAVVGPSGAGKSTLGRLLAGIHGPRTGRVEVGGVPLLELPLADLRREVALVTQEHHIFIGSIAENLLLARPESTEEELWAALDAVDAKEWIAELPEQLHTSLGGGEGLPIGPAKAQQIALARLVLADPHTLVLDEATSLLDPRAARHLERSMAAILSGRTVVAIAHRLHTAHDADRVAVVDGGRIIEIGSHDELVAQGGAYAALWNSWQS